jgi:hypothetical protein
MVISQEGNVFINNSSGVSLNSLTNKLSISSTTYNLFDISRFSDNAFGPNFYLVKSRNGTIGGNTIVANGDNLGNITWVGANGTGFTDAAAIRAEVDGTPGASNDMPGRLVFSTTADGAGSVTERMRITSEGYLRLAGAGIQFNGDTAAANSLDDYEEGTWTPTITAAGGNPSVTYSIQTGFYTKIGRQVFIQGLIYLSSKSGGSGQARISGLPFSPANVDQNFSVGTVGQMQGFSSFYGNVDGQLIVVRANQNEPVLTFYESYISNGNDWLIGNLGSTFIARFTISYFTA